MMPGFTSGTTYGHCVHASNAENKSPAEGWLPPDVLLEGI
jgi:hypothetical protein